MSTATRTCNSSKRPTPERVLPRPTHAAQTATQQPRSIAASRKCIAWQHAGFVLPISSAMSARPPFSTTNLTPSLFNGCKMLHSLPHTFMRLSSNFRPPRPSRHWPVCAVDAAVTVTEQAAQRPRRSIVQGQVEGGSSGRKTKKSAGKRTKSVCGACCPPLSFQRLISLRTGVMLLQTELPASFSFLWPS